VIHRLEAAGEGQGQRAWPGTTGANQGLPLRP
jgi:hypothetical protein